ncbi:hypothetical protein [Pedobacter sp. GR22-6]|uniref:hypothetical protein n=1 Tax=Pedobacter sp. GR22-6 TaxID=3127957 RepID=UPI00307EF3AE
MKITLSRKVYIYFLMLLAFSFVSCSNTDQSAPMLENTLKANEQHPSYQVLQDVVKKQLRSWIADGIEDTQVLTECPWKIDEAVFFNSQKDRAYLLLLIQDDLEGAKLDYVYVMYAALEKKHWNIYFAGLPNLIFPRSGNQPASWNELSQMARAELSKQYLNPQGQINDQFVNQAYTADLKAKQAKFLTKKLHR